jgi:class 3 adenylate cyclase/tetratricopeptide (TPR) repeat protein
MAEPTDASSTIKSSRRAGERRTATVMFADISGFTALSERLDPEEVTTVMNGCFARLESVVLAHGGIVDEYLGDCVKAVFGFSPASTNPISHAIQAAVEIRDTLYQYNHDANLPSPLDIHIGINTGSVIGLVMDDGREGDFCVLGDAVRLAAKLEDVSDRGDIFVGPDTYEATKDEYEYKPRDPVELRPHPLPFAVHQLIAAKRARHIKRDSERRQATVVFAEVAGLDALSAHYDPGELGDIMNRLFATLATVVNEYGGVVDKFLGEGIMALFGVPNAIENAPRQAINAAIEIRNRLARFTSDHQLPLQLSVHIGINTGLCIAGDIGGRVKHNFTVMGDTVNLAARLKEAAEHGTIFVGPETQRSTLHDFELAPTEPLRLKGKAEPVPAYRVLSVTAQLHRTSAGHAARMVFSAMVGRESELAAFRSALEATAAGNGGIVSLIGEAGLGKSRLLSEVIALAERLGVQVLLGRSLSVGRGQSFHPFVDLLRHWARVSDDAGDEQTAATFEAAIGAVMPEQVDEVFPFISRLLGLHVQGAAADRLAGIEGEALETLILKSMRELLAAIARRQPTALVFEDLHWADLSSLNLLESLLALSTELPLLFVHVARPLFEETSDRIVRICNERFPAQHREIRLDKLDDAESNLLIRNLLNIDDLPVAVRTLIASKAEGNPFYIEEVVRSLIDQGAVEHHDGRYRVTEKISTVVIPGTIHDVIMARVDRLDESARQLLQIAAVIGRHFYHRIVAHIIEREGPLDADLALLKEKQFIETGAGQWEVAVGRTLADELEYIFKHALAQEAIYESVLIKTRKDLHRRVAEAIESLFAERLPELYATLAYHYTRSEQLEPAENYLCRAGEEAARAAASAEALQLFREAAAIYDKLHGAEGGESQHRAFLEKNVGLALLNSGQHTESINHFDAALEWLGEPVAKSEVAQALRWFVDMAIVLFRIYVYEGRPGAVSNLDHQREIFKLYFERGHAEVTSAPRRLFLEMATPLRRAYQLDRHLIEQACGMYVSAAMLFAYSGLSSTISKRMLAEAKALLPDDNIHDIFRYRSMVFIYHYLRGDWEDAPTLDDELVAEALRHGLVWDVSLYLGIESDRRFRRGDFAGAHRCLAQLTELRDSYGYAYAANNYEGELLLLLMEERKAEEAVPLADQHIAAWDEAAIHVMSLGEKAKAQILLGDRLGAAESLQRALAVTKREAVLSPWHQSSHFVAQLLFDVTALEAAAAGGDRSQWSRLKRAATRSARRATRTAAKVAKDRVEAYNLAARACWVLGRRRAACQWWRQSIAEALRMGARPQLARAYMAIGERLGSQSLDGITGSTYLHMARQLFTELGLARDLQQLSLPPSTEADAALKSRVA